MFDNLNKVIFMYYRVMVKLKFNKFVIICDDKM